MTAGLLGWSLVLAASSGWAEPNAADKETARRLMTEGRTHRKANDWKGALQSFLAADAIMHVPTTGLEVARAEIELGQLVEAREKLLAVARLPVDGDEPRAFTEARATAKVLGAEIEPKIPSILVKLAGATDNPALKVTVDGVEVPSAALSVPRAVDPGHHVVAVRVGGGGAHEAQVDVQEAETKEVPLEVPSGQASSTDTEAEPSSDTGTSNDRTSKWRIPTYVGFGVGGAGLIMGSITGLLAISDFNSAKKQGCVGNQCPPAANADLDKAGTMATLSTVGFIVAGVGVGAGVLGFVLGRRPSAPTTPSAPAADVSSAPTLDLYFGPRAGGASGGVRGSF
jgi:hypothetical protein